MSVKQCGCQTQGIAIFPVIYTVVPKALNCPQPDWVNLSSVTNVPLDKDYQYHARSLRKGFLYVYLPNEIGENKWQAYTTDDNGNLYKQHNPYTVKLPDEIIENGGFQCPNLRSNESHNKFITISSPQEQKEVYIAFSDIPWDEKIIELHEKDPEKRMQKIIMDQWKGNTFKTMISSTTATEQTIKQILDFDPNFDEKKLPYDEKHKWQSSYQTDNQKGNKNKNKNKKEFYPLYSGYIAYTHMGMNENDGTIGLQPFGYDEKILKSNTTNFVWTRQNNLVKKVVSSMQEYSKDYTPLIFAIEDPMGIAQELNGYYLDIFDKDNHYRRDLEFEFDALESYEYALELLIQKEFVSDYQNNFTTHPYLKQVMKDKAIPQAEELPIFSTFNQLSVLVSHELYGKPFSGNYLPYIQVDDAFRAISNQNEHYDWERNYYLHGKDYNLYNFNVDDYSKIYSKERLKFSCKSYIESPLPVRNLQNQISYNSIQSYFEDKLISYKNREEQFKQDKKDKIKNIQEKYAKCLDNNMLDMLKQQYKNLQERIASIAEERALQVINWLQKSNFYLHMKDLDGNIWCDVIANNEKKDILDNQFEINEALSDNEITKDEAQIISKQINPYGMIYSSIVDNCTSCLELTEIGKSYLNSCLKFNLANEDKPDSIIVRGIANNSDMVLKNIQMLLEKIQNSNSSEEIDINEVMTSTKIGKIAAYYKKIQGFLNAVDSYDKSVKKAQEILTKHPDILEHLNKFGIKLNNNEHLLKIFLSRPFLAVNSLAVRLCNIMFYPINSSKLINYMNASLCLALHTSVLGLHKKGTQVVLEAQNEVRKTVIKSSWFKGRLPKTKTLDNGKVVNLTTRERVQILKEKRDYLKSQNRKNDIISKALNYNHGNNLTELNKTKDIDLSNRKNMAAEKSTGFKDIRLAFIIGVFEIFNWLKIKEQTKGQKDDSFWSAEMIACSLSMSAATTELLYQFIKVTASNNTVAAGRIKVLSGFLGAATGVFAACQRLSKVKDEIEKGNMCLAVLHLLTAAGYFTNAILGLMASSTYHIKWLTSALRNKALEKIITDQASKTLLVYTIGVHATKIMSKRVLFLGLGLWFSIIILLIEGLIWYLSDDDLEEWIKYSALGTNRSDHIAYHLVSKQRSEFKKVLESMFGIKESDVEINNQNKIIAKLNTSKLSTKTDKELNTTFNEYDALKLITEDLARRQQVRSIK